MSLVNYLGTYETLDQVWETYPEGGKEGDYLYIASVLKKWNKYTSAWVDATQEDVEGSTIMSLEEDVVVGSSTLINYLGRFETLENAINTYPEGGNEGDYIYVGDDIYAWDKYANGWFVSSDTPLEVSISEEDIIPDSNTFINYLGGFVDRDAVWHKYPEGGKVGDYLYIASDLHIWDKYICNWVAATPPDESSQIRPIEHLSQEGVVEYSENYINYLGVFESIEQAWEAYPEGGKEGDYIIVGGEQLRWNKYTANWGEYDPDASTPARPVATIYGDLHVHNDVIIGEDLYARILETFTTKKWVLEQGYISLDDVTSELVMSKIVPDNTTIEVRDGKLVVIGGGGGGTADSVAWDDVTGKPEWIGDTKPTYTLDEIAGSNGDGFVTLLSDQTIEGVKNFANGAKFNGALLSYDEEKKAWVFPGNIIASGGITAFGSLSTPVASLFEALPIDGTTIKRDPITNELYVDTNVVGGSGGGSLDEEQLEEFLRPYATIVYVSNNYASKTSVDKALSDKANKATTLAGYGITDAYTKSDIDATVDSINTSISNLRKYADDTFVTISTPQRITARHNFIDGLKINGLPIYNSQDDVVYIDANLVVRGGVTAWGTNEETAPNIFEGLPIDGTSIYWDNGVLKSSATSSGGINEELLEEYLRPYATQSWVTDKGYITSSALEPYALKTSIPTNTNQLTNGAGFITGITSSMVTNALGYTPVAVNIGLTSADNNAIGYGDVGGGWPEAGSAMVFGAGNYKAGIQVGALGSAIRYGYTAGAASFTWRTILDDNNYSNYALPTSGGNVSGKLGVNNPDPQATFQVYGTSYLRGDVAILSESVNNNNNSGKLRFGGHYDYEAGAYIQGINVDTYGRKRLSFFTTNAESTTPSWVEAMTILPTGNVAIGGTTASEKLEVYGNVKATSFIGSLSGNAATATLATYLKTTSFSGADSNTLYDTNMRVAYHSGLPSGMANLPITAGYQNAILSLGLHDNGATAQLYFSRTHPLYYRSSVDGEWRKILDSNNYSEYALPKDGTAASANRLIEEVVTDLNNATVGRIFTMTSGYGSTNGNKPTTGWVTGLTLQFAQNGVCRRQLAYSDDFFVRDENNGSWGDWRKILTSFNFYDYALPITGGKINGDLEVSGCLYSSGRNLRIGSKEASMAGIEIALSDTDYWQISHRGSFSNNELHFYHNANGTWSNSVLSLISDGSVIVGNNLLAKGGITATNSSDERLKRNLRKFNASKVLMSLGGVYEYEYIDSEVQKNHIYEGTHYGLIYQHVKGTKLDVMCHEREDGMGALNYIHPKFISLIAGATMDNISEVEKLKRKIRNLEAKVKQLENRA